MGVVSCSVLFERCFYGRRLAMSAAVAAATVEAATTAVGAATAYCTTAAHRSTVEPAADCLM
jgi:hypothetical protein